MPHRSRILWFGLLAVGLLTLGLWRQAWWTLLGGLAAVAMAGWLATEEA